MLKELQKESIHKWYVVKYIDWDDINLDVSYNWSVSKFIEIDEST